MSVRIHNHVNPVPELHPRLLQVRDRRTVAERLRMVGRAKPSARDLFPPLRERLLASRPVLAFIDEGTPSQRVIFGEPTFRNVIVNGEHL